MTALEIWLVRHGETEFNRDSRLSGWSDVPLTELGREQASALRPFLSLERFTGVWSSDLGRAIETALLAFGPAQPDERIREINFGDYEGLAFESIPEAEQEALIAFDGFRAPGGESVEELEARVGSFVSALPAGRHLVFTHGGVVRALTRRLGPDRFVPNASVVGVSWSARKLLFLKESPLARATVLAEPTGA